MSYRVLIVDDHAIVRAGLRSLLNGEASLDLVGEATNGEEALRHCQELKPDVMVLDLSLPGMDGIQVLKKIKIDQPEIKVLILTVHEDEAFLLEAIKAGASGYILKHAAESELVSAIYSVMMDDIYVHPRMIRSLLTEAEPHKRAAPSSADQLTPREMEILLLIVQGYTNRQIAEELTLSIRTVEGHRSNLMEKLGLRSRVELVRFAREQGLINHSR